MAKQRYNTGNPEHRQYRDYYINLQVNSRILNSGKDAQPNILTPFWNKATLEAELITLVGNAKGLFKRESQTSQAHIPAAEQDIEKIEKEFQFYCRLRVNTGHEKPTEYPREMLRRKLEAEARLDVKMAEKDWVEKKLSLIKDVKDIEDERQMLVRGPQGIGSFHGLGTDYYSPKRAKAELDLQYLSLVGQNEENPEGFVIIDDPKSPYNGMRTSDYYRLCKYWKWDRIEMEAKRLKKIQEKAKSEHEAIPKSLPFKSSSVVSKKDLPKWPEWAVKYDKNGQPIAEDGSATVRRTK